WGLHNFPNVIEGRATDTVPLAVAINPADCEDDFSIDVETPLAGANGIVPAGWGCLTDAEHRDGSDILIVRRAEETATATADLEAGRVYVRADESPRGRLFTGAEPAGFSIYATNHALVSNVYYVRPWSFTDANGDRDDIPSLRRKRLRVSGGAMELFDEEVITGVEDMQVQFGVDTSGDNAADLYVDADNDTVLDAVGADVVSARVWLLMRAETPEVGYSDDRAFVLGDTTRTAGTDIPANFRRVVLSRTIAVRNP
ncbi:MAG: PilW family protein, partial [Pseudomonadota bacterium]